MHGDALPSNILELNMSYVSDEYNSYSFTVQLAELMDDLLQTEEKTQNLQWINAFSIFPVVLVVMGLMLWKKMRQLNLQTRGTTVATI